MKIVIISDTHQKHGQLFVPDGDMIIHAGDISTRGYRYETLNFLTWFSSLPHKYKVFIAGNHDFDFEQSSDINSIIPENVIYLNDSGVSIEGIKIWGSPIQPWFYNWAFNRQPGDDIKKHWDLIPMNTDILITHGPPKGILDKVKRGGNVGCPSLMEKVLEVKPKYHIFGHIHEAAGIEKIDETTFINASVLDENYRYTNPITEIQYLK